MDQERADKQIKRKSSMCKGHTVTFFVTLYFRGLGWTRIGLIPRFLKVLLFQMLNHRHRHLYKKSSTTNRRYLVYLY